MKVDYRELKQRVRLVDLLTSIDWKSTKGRGEQLRGPCPLPGCSAESTDRVHENSAFSVHTTRNVYQCFRCRAAGNVLDFWQAYRAIGLYQAATELNISKTSNHNSA